jgi:hypothetical protein
MTVSELIAALAPFPPDMRVVVKGFDESGFDDPARPSVVHVNFSNAQEVSHSGRYEQSYAPGGEEAVLVNF